MEITDRQWSFSVKIINFETDGMLFLSEMINFAKKPFAQKIFQKLTKFSTSGTIRFRPKL